MEPKPEFYTVSQFIAAARISRRTFDKWLKREVTPRMERVGPDAPWRIPAGEWRLWFAALDHDRKKYKKPHLRHPLELPTWDFKDGNAVDRPVEEESPGEAVFGEALAIVQEQRRARLLADFEVEIAQEIRAHLARTHGDKLSREAIDGIVESAIEGARRARNTAGAVETLRPQRKASTKAEATKSQ